MAQPVELRTARLVLRQWRDDDLAPFAALNADPRVMEHLPAPLDRPASDALAAGKRADIDARGWGLWAVEVSGVTTFAGFIGLQAVTFDVAFVPAVEIGWRLAAEHWGRGYATEGARAAVGFAFGELDLAEIVSFTVPANERSRSVMRKLSMTHDAREDFEHPRLPPGHPTRLHVLYRLARSKETVGGP